MNFDTVKQHGIPLVPKVVIYNQRMLSIMTLMLSLLFAFLITFACTSNEDATFEAGRIPTLESMAATLQAERFATSTAAVATRESKNGPDRDTKENVSDSTDLRSQCTEQFLIVNAKGRYAETAMTDEAYSRALDKLQARGMHDRFTCGRVWDELDAQYR